MVQNWQKYYQQTKNRPPSPLLIKAMGFVHKKDMALDLGSGALIDSGYLVSQGFKKVIAIDAEAMSEEFFTQFPKDQFEFIHTQFDQFIFPIKEYTIINAQYSLPFNSPQTFANVWQGVKNSLAEGGIFTGQFFGVNDEWNALKRPMTFHTKTQVLDMLSGMQIIELREEEKDGILASGDKKHWHLFHVIAKVN